MLEYDGDLHIPSRYLVAPPEIKNTLGEHLCKSGVRQLAISETQKYGHVTYFWNGNKSGKFDDKLGTYIEIPSDIVPFEERPWMKAAEITDKLIEQMRTGKYDFVRVNFPNGDMVGHTGVFQATRIAVETVDLCLKRILSVVDELVGWQLLQPTMEMLMKCLKPIKRVMLKDDNGTVKAKTSHTLNKVPFIIYDNYNAEKFTLKQGDFGLANIASTVANLLGYEAPDFWEESMISIDK